MLVLPTLFRAIIKEWHCMSSSRCSTVPHARHRLIVHSTVCKIGVVHIGQGICSRQLPNLLISRLYPFKRRMGDRSTPVGYIIPTRCKMSAARRSDQKQFRLYSQSLQLSRYIRMGVVGRSCNSWETLSTASLRASGLSTSKIFENNLFRLCRSTFLNRAPKSAPPSVVAPANALVFAENDVIGPGGFLVTQVEVTIFAATTTTVDIVRLGITRPCC